MGEPKRLPIALLAIACLMGFFCVLPAWGQTTGSPGYPSGQSSIESWGQTTSYPWSQGTKTVEPPFAPGREGGVRLGPLRVHAGVAISETYTDNYFLDPDSRRSEWITAVSPTAVLHLPIGRHSVDMEYRSDFFINAKYNEYNTDNHLVHPHFTLDFPGGLMIKGGHMFAVLSNPPTVPGDTLKRFYDNVSNLGAEYRFSDRYSVAALYAHGFHRMEKDQFSVDDSDRDDVTLNLNYRVLPKTSVFLEGGWTRTTYPSRGLLNSDNDLYRVWIGARTTPAAKIVGSLKGGWSYKTFDDEQAGAPVSTYGVEGNLSYELTPRTRFSLILFRRIEDTQFTTTRNVAFGSSYTATGGALEARQLFPPRLSAYIMVGLEHDQYSEQGLFGEKRMDTLVQAGLGLDYRFMRWLTLGLNYKFTNNDSNIEGEGYRENRVMAYASAGF